MSEAAFRQRLPGLDVARGIAVLAMIIYHFVWDLRFLGFIQTEVAAHWFWQNFARLIAASFLLISGISLALMARGGLDHGLFFRRLGVVAAAALAVSAATLYATPDSFVFFGILHCIALSSLIALPFLRLPAVLTVAAAMAVVIMPFVAAHPVFDAPLLQWTGLGTKLPVTNDYVPVFPWAAFVLFGVVLGGRIAAGPPAALGAEPSPAMRPFAQAGRWSLVIYLVHQPVLLALLGIAALGLPRGGPDQTTLEFRRACQESCLKTAAPAAECPLRCACAEEDIKKAELWTPLLRNALTARQQQQLMAITEACQAKARQ